MLALYLGWSAQNRYLLSALHQSPFLCPSDSTCHQVFFIIIKVRKQVVRKFLFCSLKLLYFYKGFNPAMSEGMQIKFSSFRIHIHRQIHQGICRKRECYPYAGIGGVSTGTLMDGIVQNELSVVLIWVLIRFGCPFLAWSSFMRGSVIVCLWVAVASSQVSFLLDSMFP